jgi:TonB family protein
VSRPQKPGDAASEAPTKSRSEPNSVDQLVSDLLHRIDAVGLAPGKPQSRKPADLDALLAEILGPDSAAQPTVHAVPAREAPEPAKIPVPPASIGGGKTCQPEQEPNLTEIDARIARTLHELKHVNDPNAAAPPAVAPLEVPIPAEADSVAQLAAAPEVPTPPVIEILRAEQTAAQSVQTKEPRHERRFSPLPGNAPGISPGPGPAMMDDEPRPFDTNTRLRRSRRPLFFALSAVVLIGVGVSFWMEYRSSEAARVAVPETTAVPETGTEGTERISSPAQAPSTRPRKGLAPGRSASVTSGASNSAQRPAQAPDQAAPAAVRRDDRGQLTEGGLAPPRRDDGPVPSVPEAPGVSPDATQPISGGRNPQANQPPTTALPPPVQPSAQVSGEAGATRSPAPPVASPALVTLSRSAVPAQVITRVRPRYPEEARNMKLSGEVVITADVDAQGKVTKAVVDRGHPLLRDAAVEAVMRWHFKPASLKGVDIPSQCKVSVVFTTP